MKEVYIGSLYTPWPDGKRNHPDHNKHPLKLPDPCQLAHLALKEYLVLTQIPFKDLVK